MFQPVPDNGRISVGSEYCLYLAVQLFVSLKDKKGRRLHPTTPFSKIVYAGEAFTLSDSSSTVCIFTGTFSSRVAVIVMGYFVRNPKSSRIDLSRQPDKNGIEGSWNDQSHDYKRLQTMPLKLDASCVLSVPALRALPIMRSRMPRWMPKLGNAVDLIIVIGCNVYCHGTFCVFNSLESR